MKYDFSQQINNVIVGPMKYDLYPHRINNVIFWTYEIWLFPTAKQRHILDPWNMTSEQLKSNGKNTIIFWTYEIWLFPTAKQRHILWPMKYDVRATKI